VAGAHACSAAEAHHGDAGTGRRCGEGSERAQVMMMSPARTLPARDVRLSRRAIPSGGRRPRARAHGPGDAARRQRRRDGPGSSAAIFSRNTIRAFGDSGRIIRSMRTRSPSSESASGLTVVAIDYDPLTWRVLPTDRTLNEANGADKGSLARIAGRDSSVGSDDG